MQQEQNHIRSIFNLAVSSEIAENTQQLPKNKKEQLIMYWKAVAILIAEQVLKPEQVNEILVKYNFTEPTSAEILAKVMLAQCTQMQLRRAGNKQSGPAMPDTVRPDEQQIPTTPELRAMFLPKHIQQLY